MYQPCSGFSTMFEYAWIPCLATRASSGFRPGKHIKPARKFCPLSPAGCMVKNCKNAIAILGVCPYEHTWHQELQDYIYISLSLCKRLCTLLSRHVKRAVYRLALVKLKFRKIATSHTPTPTLSGKVFLPQRCDGLLLSCSAALGSNLGKDSNAAAVLMRLQSALLGWRTLNGLEGHWHWRRKEPTHTMAAHSTRQKLSQSKGINSSHHLVLTQHVSNSPRLLGYQGTKLRPCVQKWQARHEQQWAQRAARANWFASSEAAMCA